MEKSQKMGKEFKKLIHIKRKHATVDELTTLQPIHYYANQLVWIRVTVIQAEESLSDISAAEEITIDVNTGGKKIHTRQEILQNFQPKHVCSTHT